MPEMESPQKELSYDTTCMMIGQVQPELASMGTKWVAAKAKTLIGPN